MNKKNHILLCSLLLAVLCIPLFAVHAHAEVCLPASLKVISEEAFEYDQRILNVVIPDGCTSIGNRAFFDCRNLMSVHIPDSVTYIGDETFENCDDLTIFACADSYAVQYAKAHNIRYVTDDAVIIASGQCGKTATWRLTEEGDLLVEGTGQLDYGGLYSEYGSESIMISTPWGDYRNEIVRAWVGEGITVINYSSFRNCENMISVSLPSTLSEIRGCAFECSYSLLSVTIPSSISELGGSVFNNCEGLQNVKLPEGLTAVSNGCFMNCHSLTQVTVPSTVTAIDDYAFYRCFTLSDIVLPEGLKTIGNYAFADTAIKDLYLPRSVESIGSTAFNNISGFVAHVYEGSYAHQWCEENRVKYVLIDESDSDEDIDHMNALLLSGLSSAVSQYTGSDGYVSETDMCQAASAVRKYVEEQYLLGLVASYEYDDFCVCFTDAQYGFNWIYSPRVKGIQAGDGKVEIITIEPNATEFSNSGVSTVEHAQTIANTIPDFYQYYSANHYTDSEVNFKTILDCLGPNRIILWLGHSGQNGILLETGLHASDFVDTSKENWPWELESVLSKQGIDLYTEVKFGIEENNYPIYIHSNFIRNHYKGNLINSFVWLGACTTMASDGIWKVFQEKQAAVIVGFTNIVHDTWDMENLELYLDYMMKINPETQKHYNLMEAQNKVKMLKTFDYIFFHEGKFDLYSFLKISGDLNFSFWPSKVTGHIVDKDDPSKPVADAKIVVSKKNAYSSLQYFTTVNADSQGYFEFEVPNKASYQCDVSHSLYVKDSFDVYVTGYEMLFDETWEISKKGTLTGTIAASDDNQPIKGASVRVEKQTAVSDSRGKYTIDVPDTNVTAVFSAEGFKEKSVPLTVPVGSVMTYDAVLEPQPGYLMGYVTSELTGAKLDGVSLSLYDKNGKLAASTTTAGGGFYILEAQRGQYTLKATKNAYREEKLTVTVLLASTAEYSFPLYEEKAAVSGKVMDKETLAGIPGATVTLIRGEASFTATADSNGAYSIDVDTGKYQVTVQAQGYQSSNDELTLTESVQKDFQLPKTPDTAYTVSGKAFKAFSDSLVSGVTLELHTGYAYYPYDVLYLKDLYVFEQAGYDKTPLLTTVTADDGSYSMQVPVAAQPVNGVYQYTIVAKMDGWLTNYVTFSIAENAEQTVVVKHIAFAPEGSGLRIEGYKYMYDYTTTCIEGILGHNDFCQDLNPYISMLNGNVRLMEQLMNGTPMCWYDCSPVYIYLNDTLIITLSCPKSPAVGWKSSTHYAMYWHAFYINNGILYTPDDFSENELSSKIDNENYWEHGMKYPSWMK